MGIVLMKPKNLSEILFEIENKFNEIKEVEEKEERKETEIERKFWEKENKLLPEKIKMSKEIFKWANEFAESKEYKKIIQLAKTYFIPSLVDAVGQGLRIYGIDGWGHTTEYKEHGLHSYLYVEPKGGFQYAPFYKWIGLEKFSLEKPEELAQKLSKAYIKDLHEHIESGKVIDDIIKNLRNQIQRQVNYY